MNHSRWINWGTDYSGSNVIKCDCDKVVISVERLVPWWVPHFLGPISSLFYDCSVLFTLFFFPQCRKADVLHCWCRLSGDATFQMEKTRQGKFTQGHLSLMEEPESQFLPFEFPGCCLATKPPCLFYCTAAEQALNNHNWWCWLKGRAQSDSGSLFSNTSEFYSSCGQ